MNVINLETFGFDIQPADTRDGSKVFSINTPFTVLDDEKLDIFVEESGDKLHFFDEGSLIFNLQGHGFTLSDSEVHPSWACLKEHLSSYEDIVFSDGAIELWGNIEDASGAFTKYLSALLSIETWARDQISQPTSKANVIPQAQTY